MLLLAALFLTASELPALAQESKASGTPIKIVMLGDSLTEGYGLDEEEAFPALVEKLLREEGKNVQVINAGISGSTTASGLSRLKWMMKSKPDWLVLALGANDGLRGQSTENIAKNLEEIISYAQSQNCRVLLAGMHVPTNYGKEYSEQFYSVFKRVAEKMNVPLMPFLLESVGGVKEFNLPDGLHPNQEGHKIIAKNVAGQLKKLL